MVFITGIVINEYLFTLEAKIFDDMDILCCDVYNMYDQNMNKKVKIEVIYMILDIFIF
jgi:hypothetical protein